MLYNDNVVKNEEKIKPLFVMKLTDTKSFDPQI